MADDLLIHSLSEFADVIVPILDVAEARHIVEIGAEHGTMTRRLLDLLAERDGRLTSIDPQPSPGVEELAETHAHFELVKDLSLHVLADLDADAALIDGDHNYYTVLNESKLLWEQSRRRGVPFLAIYHDVGWPCARRDQYCSPEQIPDAYRHPHTWDMGLTLDNKGVVESGFRGEGNWACALREGGAMNGVLTAIEDFVIGKEEHLIWAMIPAVFGLGVLFERQAPWAGAVAEILAPHHANPLLERLERNRLRCYLEIITRQDEARARLA